MQWARRWSTWPSRRFNSSRRLPTRMRRAPWPTGAPENEGEMGIDSAAAAVESLPLSSEAATYPAAFQATAAQVPDRPALRTARDSTHLTWDQYASAVERTAGALAGLGIRRG